MNVLMLIVDVNVLIQECSKIRLFVFMLVPTFFLWEEICSCDWCLLKYVEMLLKIRVVAIALPSRGSAASYSLLSFPSRRSRFTCVFSFSLNSFT